MPHIPYTLRRGGQYHLNLRVPIDLREVLGKEFIRRSLKTSDPKEARRLVTFEKLKEEARFDRERAKLRPRSTPPLVIQSLSKSEQRDLAFRWFIQREEESEKWRMEEAPKLKKRKSMMPFAI